MFSGYVSALPEDKRWPDFLSEEEVSFLQEHPVIRFRVRSRIPPFEFVRDGEATGLAVDYIRLISKQVGFQAVFVADDRPLKEAFNEIEQRRKDFDTLTYTVKSPERAARFSFGEAFLSYPIVVIVNKDSPPIFKVTDLNGKVVSLETGYLTNQWIGDDYPQLQIANVPTTEQALLLVNNGVADAYIGNLAIANYMIVNGRMDKLKVAIPTKYKNIDFSFIAPKEWSVLTSIMNKGFRSITAKQHSALQLKWFTVQTVEQTNYGPALYIFVTAIFIIVLFFWWNMKLAFQKQRADKALSELLHVKASLEKKNGELEKISTTDSLTNLYNRGKIEKILVTEFERVRRYGGNLAIIMADVDHFKSINDTYGHQVGDLVLVNIARLFESRVRRVDSVGRWGGEEFLIVCPNTGLEGAFHVAEGLREGVEQVKLGVAGYRSVSLGVTEYYTGDSTATIIQRVDQALYQAKIEGRNKVVFKPLPDALKPSEASRV
ncbi:transporter substrate-binding domain-containing diguanylate cyclase [Vibrio albus]|nr:diguanylate cyclase [Vibrio albus]